MELKEIAAISGKSGLFKIVKPTRTGVIVESLDAKKKKIAIGATGKVSILKEISIYTTDADGSLVLGEVLHRMYEKYENTLPVEPKASGAELFGFMQEVVENFDEERVYASDIKKLISWYNILLKEAPEVLQRATETEEQVEDSKEKEDETTETA